MTALGAFTFVLHSHLPYARLAGRWPHGEEWVHEAASETYIPLLNALYDLRDDRVPYRLTLGITPVLAEQLADEGIRHRLEAYLNDKIARAERDRARFAPGGSDENAALCHLADFYLTTFRALKEAYLHRFGGDLIGAFKRLQDEGLIEITTSAATHGYLPLLGTDSAIRAQIQTGVQSYRRFFQRAPRGFWLPECAYRPAYYDAQGRRRPGIESFLVPHGLTVFFSETHLITGEHPREINSSEARIGLYGDIERAYVLPLADLAVAREPKTTYRAYYVGNAIAGQETDTHDRVAVLGRNYATGQRVWSAAMGYPGDGAYREFHRKDATSGLQYWAVTAMKTDLGDKILYDPALAARRVEVHARDFCALVEDLVRESEQGYGIIASNYDTELFGHWWFEGVDWLKAVLRGLAESPLIDLVTAPGYIEQHPPEAMIDLPEGSWGMGGSHFTWDNPDTHWMWEPIHTAEQRMEQLANTYQQDWHNAPLRDVLNQAARELLLLESSDWPFLVTSGQARQYAVQRFSQHLQRFQALAHSVETGTPDVEAAAAWWELDRVFPDIDYRWWCSA